MVIANKPQVRRGSALAIATLIAFGVPVGVQIAQAPAADAAEPITIGDFVWHDADRDGLQESGEPGVANIDVTLYDGSAQAVRSIVTDADGYYEFTDVEPGEYSVGFSGLPAGAEFTEKWAGGDNFERDSDADPATGRSEPITVDAENNMFLYIDAGILMDGGPDPLRGSIGDFVWFDENSDGIQQPNEPGFPGLTLNLYNEDGDLVDTVRSGSDGGYSFDDLHYGAYAVTVGELPRNVALSPWLQGDNPEKDSDISPWNGASTTIFVGSSNQNDTSIDVGLVPKAP